jgi:addiction module HigA family antidote
MKKPKLIAKIHPGEILLEDFLKPMGVSHYRLANDTGLPHPRITRLVRGPHGISGDTDARFSFFFRPRVRPAAAKAACHRRAAQGSR